MQPGAILPVILAGAMLAFPGVGNACGELPQTGCHRSEKSSLTLEQVGGSEDRLAWKWMRGDATVLGDFGDPTTTTDYEFCMYAGSHSTLISSATVPADEARWKALGKRGFLFVDHGATADGIERILLKHGKAGRSKVIVVGKGDGLPDPTLPTQLPLRVQLVNTDTNTCFEDSYDGTDLLETDSNHMYVRAGEEDPSVPLTVLRTPPAIPALSAAEAGVPAFVGTPATLQPLAPLNIPDHPWLDNDGDSRIHNDHYNSAVYNRPGPLGANPTVTTAHLATGATFVNVCAMLTFTSDGYVIGTCIRGSFAPLGGATDLVMLDPNTLDILAETEIAPRPLVPSAAGGAYFSVLQDGRILVGPANNRVEIWEVEVNGGQAAFVRKLSFDVSALLPSSTLTLLADTVIDYAGRLWFMANTGQVGYVEPETGRVETFTFSEGLQNSMAVDESGIYLVTFKSLRKFSVAPDGAIVNDWTVPYDPGSSAQGVAEGSGTTPTLFGDADDLVGICDNADDQINLLVVDRTTGAEVCKTPIFRVGESAAENTLVGYGDEVVIPNNSGFGGSSALQNRVNPGLEKYRVRADRSGCDLVWANDASIGNSAQLSTKTGLIYGWAADPNVPDFDAFYLTANDWATGDEVFRVYTGNDRPFNPVLGQPHLAPDGTAYVGTLEGIIRIGDAAYGLPR